jgi:hypothetical protein
MTTLMSDKFKDDGSQWMGKGEISSATELC